VISVVVHDPPPDARLNAEANPAAAVHGAAAWGGMAVLFVPLLGVLAIVAGVVFVGAVNEWWTLLLAMSLVLGATGCVVAAIVGMLADDG
jgi:hypothetical protein